MASLRTTLYDLMLESDATSMLMLPFYNYFYGNHDAIREMLTHPAGVVGLSDGGAYCGMICDASYPTFLLTHSARGRYGAEKLPLEYVVRKAVSRHGAAVRAIRSRRHRSRKEGRRQRD